jgi:hypothetical protein
LNLSEDEKIGKDCISRKDAKDAKFGDIEKYVTSRSWLLGAKEFPEVVLSRIQKARISRAEDCGGLFRVPGESNYSRIPTISHRWFNFSGLRITHG